MLGFKSIREPIKGKFAKEFLSEVVRIAKSDKAKKTPKKNEPINGYIINWK